MATPTNATGTIAEPLIVGAIGMLLPKYLETWGSIAVSILTAIWLVIRIAKEIRDWNKKVIE